MTAPCSNNGKGTHATKINRLAGYLRRQAAHQTANSQHTERPRHGPPALKNEATAPLAFSSPQAIV